METTIVFKSLDGGGWEADNIKVEVEGSSSYKVTVEGSSKEENIVCLVPDINSLLSFLSRLFNGSNPVFQIHPEYENIKIDKCC